jgi:hypothetical protein
MTKVALAETAKISETTNSERVAVAQRARKEVLIISLNGIQFYVDAHSQNMRQ